MDNEINSFTFYKDYYNLIDTISKKDKKELLCAIVDYVFKDIEPKGLKGHNLAIFNTLKAQLNLSKSNSKRKTKRVSEEEPKENQKETEEEPKGYPKENKTSILSFKFYISNFKFLDNKEILKNKILEWVKYKLERKETYKETGFNSLLKQIQKNVELFGEEKVIELIDECMANNYKGIIFDKLKKDSKETGYKTLHERNQSVLEREREKARKEKEDEQRRSNQLT